jgi:hypothetical protein
MNKPQQITEEELSMVRSAIMLPIVLNTLERDIKLILTANLKVPEVYIAHLKRLQGYVLEDIKVIKAEMRKRGFKILEEGKAKNGYKASYLCRSYKHEMVVGSNIIRSIVSVRIADMIGIKL